MTLAMGTHAFKSRPAGSELLMEHCLALGFRAERAPVRERLAAALGNDLACRLLVALPRARD